MEYLAAEILELAGKIVSIIKSLNNDVDLIIVNAAWISDFLNISTKFLYRPISISLSGQWMDCRCRVR